LLWKENKIGRLRIQINMGVKSKHSNGERGYRYIFLECSFKENILNTFYNIWPEVEEPMEIKTCS
jgi:hypothetical protein